MFTFCQVQVQNIQTHVLLAMNPLPPTTTVNERDIVPPINQHFRRRVHTYGTVSNRCKFSFT